MSRIRLTILLILIFFLVPCIGCGILAGGGGKSTEAASMSVVDISSTKYWQDTALQYISKRDEIIDDAVQGKFTSTKKCVNTLKYFECPPLLDGDSSLVEYILKNPGGFTEKQVFLNAECGEIRKLTKDEVVMTTKLNYTKNDKPIRCNYEIVFKNVDGSWRLSKFAFAN